MKKIVWHKTARGAKRGGEHCPPVDILFSDQAKQNVERLKQNDALLSREMRINQMIWSEYYGASKGNNLKIKIKHFHIICIIYNYYLKTYFPYWHIFILIWSNSYLSDFQFQHSLSEAQMFVCFNLTSVFVPHGRGLLLHVAHLVNKRLYLQEGLDFFFLQRDHAQIRVSPCTSAPQSTPGSPHNSGTRQSADLRKTSQRSEGGKRQNRTFLGCPNYTWQWFSSLWHFGAL